MWRICALENYVLGYVFVCRLFATRPLSETIMAYYYVKPWEHISVKIE